MVQFLRVIIPALIVLKIPLLNHTDLEGNIYMSPRHENEENEDEETDDEENEESAYEDIEEFSTSADEGTESEENEPQGNK